jgi:hypothetical protein
MVSITAAFREDAAYGGGKQEGECTAVNFRAFPTAGTRRFAGGVVFGDLSCLFFVHTFLFVAGRGGVPLA